MGYMHINNLYKDKTILIFKMCYVLEKIHGTSAHIKWKHEEQKVIFFSGGASNEQFTRLFDKDKLKGLFQEHFPASDVTIFGEAYGGKVQKMKHIYGDELRFVAFDVQVDGLWLDVPKADNVVTEKFGLEFVYYVQAHTGLDLLNELRDSPSQQAARNGLGTDKYGEGVVLRPVVEVRLNNGERVIAKHKRDEFSENASKKEVSEEELKVMVEAKDIADEWATEMRLTHVLDKLDIPMDMSSTGTVIKAMIEDIYREAKGEIVENARVAHYIGKATAIMFKRRIKGTL